MKRYRILSREPKALDIQLNHEKNQGLKVSVGIKEQKSYPLIMPRSRENEYQGANWRKIILLDFLFVGPLENLSPLADVRAVRQIVKNASGAASRLYDEKI